MLAKYRLAILLLPALLAGLALSGCAAPAAANDGSLRVVATTGMIGDLAANIGGEHVEVTTLMGPGVDPHLYSATERDVETLQGAELILYNGLNLEARMADVFEQLDSPATLVVAVGDNIPADRILLHAGYEGQPDPHVWMDPALWRFAAEAVRDALITADPENETSYRANADRYLGEIDALDTWVRASVETIPAGQRRLVTAHDAFQYYSRSYGLDVFSPQGISTEAEASVADIQSAVDYVVANSVPAVFFESSIPIDTVLAISAGAEARGHTLALGGELFSDAMGEAGTPEGTYLGMIRHNTRTIVTALGGTPLDE